MTPRLLSEGSPGIQNRSSFADVHDARRIIEAWRIDYNASGPHSALDYAAPDEFASSLRGLPPER